MAHKMRTPFLLPILLCRHASSSKVSAMQCSLQAHKDLSLCNTCKQVPFLPDVSEWILIKHATLTAVCLFSGVS